MRLNKLLEIFTVQENILIQLNCDEPKTIEEFYHEHKNHKYYIEEFEIYILDNHDEWSDKYKPGTVIANIYCDIPKRK